MNGPRDYENKDTHDWDSGDYDDRISDLEYAQEQRDEENEEDDDE